MTCSISCPCPLVTSLTHPRMANKHDGCTLHPNTFAPDQLILIQTKPLARSTPIKIIQEDNSLQSWVNESSTMTAGVDCACLRRTCQGQRRLEGKGDKSKLSSSWLVFAKSQLVEVSQGMVPCQGRSRVQQMELGLQTWAISPGSATPSRLQQGQNLDLHDSMRWCFE